MPERSNMCYIFEKRIFQGYKKLHSHEPNAQTQKKIQNTQIPFMNTQIYEYINTIYKFKIFTVFLAEGAQFTLSSHHFDLF